MCLFILFMQVNGSATSVTQIEGMEKGDTSWKWQPNYPKNTNQPKVARKTRMKRPSKFSWQIS